VLSRQVAGIFLTDYEQGEIGHDLFHAACRMSLEGIVSKHRGRAYRGGRCRHWLKVKNRAHLACNRVRDLHAARLS
jgi:ATP-dependent DNA ligase